jgi:hypothetical protein
MRIAREDCNELTAGWLAAVRALICVVINVFRAISWIGPSTPPRGGEICLPEAEIPPDEKTAWTRHRSCSVSAQDARQWGSAG